MSNRPTLLLVDDEASVLTALRRELKNEGYRLLIAESGAAAVALLEEHEVDILISDIDMPEMNGLELLALVRERWPRVVRLVLTGGSSLESAIGAINEGEVHRYLTKPWSHELLLETVRSTVARLEALRGPSSAGGLSHAQETLRGELEALYPGILEVERSDDAYVIDDARLGNVLRGLDRPSRERFEAAALASIDDVTRVVVEEP